MREDGRSVEGGRREGDHQSLRPLLLVLLLRSLLYLLLFLHPLLLSFSLPPPYVYRLFLSPSVPTYYPLYLPSALSFSVVHPSTTLAGRPPSLLSPFPFPSSVRRSLAHSLACLLAHSHSLTRSLVRSSSLPPCPSYLQALPSLSSPSPVSPVVSLCLSSLFVSLFHPFSPHPFSPHRSILLLRPSLPVNFFYPPFASAVPLTLSFSFSLAFSISPFLLPSLVSPFSVLLLFSAPHLSSTAPPSPLFRTLFFFPFAFTLRVSPFRSPFPCSPFESPGTYTLGLFPSIYYPLYHRGGKLVKKYIFYGLQYVDG